MDRFKRVIIFLLAGVIVGAAVSTLMAKYYIVFDNTTAVKATQQVDLPEVTKQIISSVVNWQLIGGAVGGLAGLIAGLLTFRKKRPAATGTTGATTPPTAGVGTPPSTPAI